MPRKRTHDELQQFVRRMLQLGAGLVLLVLAGAVGLAVAEDRSLWRGFLWSLDTVATVGSYPPPGTTAGQIIKVLLVLTGVGTLFYALVTVTEFFVAGHLGDLFNERRLNSMTSELTDHVIICGYGRVGRQVARDLAAAGVPYLVIDSQESVVERARDDGALAILGDASEDDVLRGAGLERAHTVVACVDSDAENVFITLSARELRGEDELLVVARAATEEAERKLRRAGADRLVSPYKTSGAEIARLAQHPQISGALGISPGFRLDEIDVQEGCAGIGSRLSEIRGATTIVGVRRGGHFVPSPPEDTRLQSGDVVVAMGADEEMDALERRFDAAG